MSNGDFPRKLQREAVAAATRAAFASDAWTAPYFGSTALVPIRAPSGSSSSGGGGGGSAFTNRTLASHATVTAAQHFYLPSPPKPLPSLTPYTPSPAKPDSFGQLWTLYRLGPGAEGGQPGVAHGGCIAALMDEQASALMRAWAAAGLEGMVFCNVRYHGAIRVPGAILCKAWKARVEGRKVWVEIAVEDGDGRVMVRGEVLFVNDERGGAKL